MQNNLSYLYLALKIESKMVSGEKKSERKK